MTYDNQMSDGHRTVQEPAERFINESKSELPTLRGPSK